MIVLLLILCWDKAIYIFHPWFISQKFSNNYTRWFANKQGR